MLYNTLNNLNFSHIKYLSLKLNQNKNNEKFNISISNVIFN